MNKRGISLVVASVLLILMVVVLIALLWLFLLPYLQKIDLEQDTGILINFAEGYTCYDASNNVSMVQITRGASDTNLSGLNVVFLKDGNSHSFYPDSLDPNSKKVFTFEIPGEIDEVRVAPIFLKGGKEVLGDFSSSGKIFPCSNTITVADLLYEDCGNGKIDDGEECGEPGLPECESGKNCEGCKCKVANCEECTSWQDSDCGEGECALNQMYQTCNTPPECSMETRCIDHSNCSCNILLSPGTNVIYNEILNVPDSSELGYNQYTICLNPGNYFESLLGSNGISNKSGISLIGYSGRPKIDLMEELGIKLINSSYMILDNLEIFNTSNHGVYMFSGSNNILNNSIIHDTGNDAITIEQGENHLISYNTVYNSDDSAIYVRNGEPKNVVFKNNYLWKGIGLQYSNGIIYISSDNIIIDYYCNYMNASDEAGGGFAAAIGVHRTDNLHLNFSYNYIDEKISYDETTTNLYWEDLSGSCVHGNKTVIISNCSGSATIGTFIFENNYCNEFNNPAYCDFSADSGNYASWKTVCGHVGAYDMDYS